MQKERKESNINSNLETDLRNYCKTFDGELFEEKIYMPLRYMASHIISKNKFIKENIEELINDCVAYASIKLPDWFDENKGMSAKSLSYIIMKQYIHQIYKFNTTKKRNSSLTIFIEDINPENYPAHLTIIEFDELKAMKDRLLEHQSLFEKIENKLHRKISGIIIDCILHPENYKENKNSFIPNIAKKAKVNPCTVHQAIKSMHAALLLQSAG